MSCNHCEESFNSEQSVVVSIERSGGTARLHVNNRGQNIVLIRRILLCRDGPAATDLLYLRPPPDPPFWNYPYAFLESGTGALFYQLSVADTDTVQAQAEYVEIDGRSRSCVAAAGDQL